ncbi:SUMF1/EgtB/PvdO family nonheme iron enzyme [Ideonella sp. 4Y16]|uniref:SUMF1/EgtB/PvdO family nonheme iron enzyme n=1 Tax=Ideonella alba TaxID=2824118 RepID=UPI001B39C1CE|nr:SUMF1/EgtB/PvdO family nonheme iron enzyme [Ideonella alba]MBQ0942258.1 SUMF1/EgtB/PvdO family nonheme iron enzyme [Ideonella alba]
MPRFAPLPSPCGPDELVDLVRQQRAQHLARQPMDPLPTELLHQPVEDLRWPLWLDLCRVTMAGAHTQRGEGDELRWHLVSDATVDHGWHPTWGSEHEFSPHAPLSARRAAQLAAAALWPGDAMDARGRGWTPHNQQEDLLHQALRHGHVDPPHLRFMQPMVSDWLGAAGYGTLTELLLWVHPTTPLDWPEDSGRLLRAPGAALLPVDDTWALGLARVRALLDAVLQPDAPAVSWSVHPSTGLTQASGWPLPAVTGTSASATLAVGALWLLRDHLRTDSAALRTLKGALCQWRPGDLNGGLLKVLISAELGETVLLDANSSGAPEVQLPELGPVGGATDKLAAALDLHPHRQPQARWFAKGQAGAGITQAMCLPDLATLVDRVAQAASPLNDDQRELHALLLDPHLNEGQLDADLLESVAHAPSPNLTTYLLGCYARNALCRYQQLGESQPLLKHYVRLQLTDLAAKPTRQGGTDETDDSPRNERERARNDLRELLDDPSLKPRPAAWCIEAEPYAGKTTLLTEWAARTAREALIRHHQGSAPGAPQGAAVWGEVPVLLPVVELSQLLPPDQDFGAAIIKHIEAQTPGLGFAQWLQAPATPTLQPRLLFDALDELQAASPAQRQDFEKHLVAWLAQPAQRQRLLPPVFTVRRQEKATALSNARGDWAARPVALLDFRASEMRRYLFQRFRPEDAALHRHDGPPPPPPADSPEARLLEALGLAPKGGAPADDATLNQQPLNPMADFCRTPGILAAQCTLAQAWPRADLPKRRPQLLLALVWHVLGRTWRRGALAEAGLLSDDLLACLRDGEDQLTDWTLPPEPGALLALLGHAADALQDAESGRTTEMAWSLLKAEMLKRAPGTAEAWLEGTWLPALKATGLATLHLGPDKRRTLRFVHPQFQELFAALGLRRDALPDLTPPDLDPKPGQPLRDRLAQDKNYRLQLPQVTPHHERVRMAVAVVPKAEQQKWLRHLVLMPKANLALAAQCAIDVRDVLEPDGPWRQPHPVLQHIRRLLLLASVDAGEAVAHKLRAAAVLGDHVGQAALAQDMSGDPEDVPGFADAELNAHWQAVWAAKCQGEGVDLRIRLQMGFLLGHLQDTLRYTWVEAELPDGKVRSGLVPRLHQWAMLGEYGGPKLSFRIGSDGEGDVNEQPSWTKELCPFQMARHPVTVGEWESFAQDQPGPASKRPHYKLKDDRYTNALQPAVGGRWNQCMAYADWAEPLHRALERRAATRPKDPSGWTPQRLQQTEGWQTRVPTEVLWEAGVRGPACPGQTPPRWAHEPTAGESGPLELSHGVKLDRPSPVGCCSASHTPHGVADVAGQLSNWCANALPFELLHQGYRTEQAQAAIDQTGKGERAEEWLAVRGGGFHNPAARRRPSYRSHFHPPGNMSDVLGVRLVRGRPRQSAEPRTPEPGLRDAAA